MSSERTYEESYVQAVAELERRVGDRFATRTDVEEIKEDVRELKRDVSEHKGEFGKLLTEFQGMRRTMDRVFWAIVTPLLGAVGFLILFVASEAFRRGVF